MDNRDHDLLTKIDANLENFMNRFDEHVKHDERDFSEIKRRLGLVEKSVIGCAAIGGFILLVFEVTSKLFK